MQTRTQLPQTRTQTRTRARTLALAAAALLGLAALTACDPETLAGPDLDPGAASTELESLRVGDWAAMTGYSRDRFPHWVSHGEGCDTRELVLQRDGTDVVTGSGCGVTAGEWISAYDGERFDDPSDLDVDHMVPLANAWRTGAAGWTDERRKAFANDLDRPQLFAVSASSNRSKGDQDPSQWRPPRQKFWCEYAQSWITVKAYWDLSVTLDEKAALADMLGTCS